MTPLQFEQENQDGWEELQRLLRDVHSSRTASAVAAVDGARVAALYRRACGNLALARSRSYPAYLVDRLEQMTADAHQVIYRRRELGLTRLRHLLAIDIPTAVRAHAVYVWVAAAVLTVPAAILGLLVYARPELILSLVDAPTAASYHEMYSSTAQSIGRPGGAQGDWAMFAFYIRNNVGIAFQCFAGGLFAGVGSLFYLAYNGALIGGIAGYLTQRGLGPTFYSFVVTHSAFELTAIVLAGAAGLRLGHALLAPGRQRRGAALVDAARGSVVVVYGAATLLVIAAAIEAFWSSAAWLPLPLKYSVAALCWVVVVCYLTLQGRHAG
ncbi:MAG TPA: stage II sporulation protein M [Steroidobacteraceae bacterium]|nr:stage II sporulation protein M [Steroidobacteraceae bacterium]